MTIAASTPTPRVSFGPLADRPLATADGVAGGDTYLTTDAWPQREYVVRINVSNTREWVEILTAESIIDATPQSLTIYVETTGNDSNDGLTVGTALATLGEALKRVGAYGWTGSAFIKFGLGTFAMPVAVDPAVETNIMIPACQGGNGPTGSPSQPLVIQGTMVDSGLGTRTASAVTAGTAPTFSTFTDSVGGLTPSVFKEKWLRVTSGAFANARFLVSDNDAGTITLVGTFVSGQLPTAPFTYVVESIGTMFQWSFASSGRQVALRGADVCFLGIEFSSTGNGPFFAVCGGNTLFASCKWSSTASGWAVTTNPGGARLFGTSSGQFFPMFGSLTFPSGNAGGVLFATTTLGSIQCLSASICTIRNSKIKLMNLIYSGNGSVSGCEIDGTGSNGFSASGAIAVSVTNSRFSACAGASTTLNGVVYRASVLAVNGANLFVIGCDISGTSGVNADAICALENARLSLSGVVSGTGNAGFGLRARRRSRVQVTAPNTSVTVTGTAGDVEVGAAGAKTWAQILGGAAADVLDLAAPVPELVSVSA